MHLAVYHNTPEQLAIQAAAALQPMADPTLPPEADAADRVGPIPIRAARICAPSRMHLHPRMRMPRVSARAAEGAGARGVVMRAR